MLTLLNSTVFAQQIIRTASDWSGQTERLAPGEDEPLLPPRLCVSEQVEYNSNLYRVGSDVSDIQQRLGAEARRSDKVLHTSVCANESWQRGIQELSFSGMLTDNRYVSNTFLNHTSGTAALLWNWKLADDWYGQFGGRHMKMLGNFMNDRPIVKDLVNSTQYIGQLNRDFGLYLTATVGGTKTDTSHGNSDREVDNYRSTTGYARLIIKSQADNQIRIAAQRTNAEYPQSALVNNIPFDRDYEEQQATVGFRYGLDSKTVLLANIGQLRHDYVTASDAGYSGNTWNSALQWAPSTRTQVQVKAWKTVAAYFDSEADHYLSRGAGLLANWSPRAKLQLAATLTWERQTYLRNSLTVVQASPRTDNVRSAGIGVIYAPTEYFDIDIDYRHEQHDSSRAGLGFNTNVGSIRLRAKLPAKRPEWVP